MKICSESNPKRTRAHTGMLDVLTPLVRDAAVPHRHEEIVTLPELRGLVTAEEKRMDLVIEELVGDRGTPC